MTEQNAEHPTSGRRRRYKSPPVLHDTSTLPVPRLADHLDTENGPSEEEGEKEAKRQRSEPTTPISTSSRLPYEYDEVMGITQVGPREAERFEKGSDLEYHDASENPPVPESEPTHMPGFSHGGCGTCGSSSLRECIELLNNTRRNAPATLHSGVKEENPSDPLQILLKSSPEKIRKIIRCMRIPLISVPQHRIQLNRLSQPRRRLRVPQHQSVHQLQALLMHVRTQVSKKIEPLQAQYAVQDMARGPQTHLNKVCLFSSENFSGNK